MGRKGIRDMKILWLSDFDLKGSGYYNISVPICNRLTERGHDVKALGMHYGGQEHHHNFSLLPINKASEIMAMTNNLANIWRFDVFICALDIIHQERFLKDRVFVERKFPYIGIMPLEAPPLVLEWAIVLMQMNKSLFISNFGAKEAQRMNIDAEHLQIGLDPKQWFPVTEEERKSSRYILGMHEEEFVVLTVADNQERKNLSAGMEIFAEFSKDKKAKYILVTREFNLVGWKLKSYATELGIIDKLIILERGMEINQLRMVYGASDVFFLPSKCEGLGLPLLEAMAVGVPCVGTNSTGIAELLGEGRGLLVDYEYTHRDPFGNGYRYWINKQQAVEKLNQIYNNGIDTTIATEYIKTLDWKIAVDTVEKAMNNVTKTS
jgi:glycosyltransferase involved in cell wall biosynthesis